MDADAFRQAVHQHAQAVERGDMERVTEDFVAEMRSQVPEIGKALPMPVSQAEVLKVESEGEEGLAEIRYSGEGPTVTIRSRWRESDGQPRIYAGEPI